MKNYFFLLFFFVARQYTVAQPGQIKFDHLTVKDGLPSYGGLPKTDIYFIKQDDLGYIWIGTDDGLVRYDGYKIKVYPLEINKDKWFHDNFVLNMTSDANKDLWFTVGNYGLFKYNRSSDSFTQYKFVKKPGEYHTFFSKSLFADTKNNLWGVFANLFFKGTYSKFIGFDLVRFDQTKRRFEYFGKKQAGTHYLNPTGAIFQSAAAGHSIWAGTNDGLYLYNEKYDTFYPYVKTGGAARQKSVNGIYEAPSEPGILWLLVKDQISSQLSVERFDTRNKTFEDYNHFTRPGLTPSNDTVNRVYEDSNRRLWWVSADGLMLFDRKTKKIVNYWSPDAKKTGKVQGMYNIAETKDGSLWITDNHGGLLNFNPLSHLFHRYVANKNDPYALNNNEINDLMVDRSGTLWVGTHGIGVDKLNAVTSAFTIFSKNGTEENGYPNDTTRLFISSAGGDIWFTNNRGIFKWKFGSQQFSQIYKANKTDGYPDAMALGYDGTVYFSDKNGLNVYDPVTRKRQTYSYNPGDKNSIISNQITYILQDHAGLIWIGTRNKGTCTYSPISHQFTRYGDMTDMPASNLDGNYVKTIYEDRQGIIWMGTEKEGLSCFDSKSAKFVHYALYGKKQVRNITEIYEDREGRLWVGTYRDGLFEFDRKRGAYTRQVNESNGLMYYDVSGIREDHSGFLWINSLVGLTRLKLSAQNLYVKTYPFDAILPGQNASMFINQNLIDVNGLMAMSISDGITVFNPRDLNDDTDPPPVHLEQLSFSNPSSTLDRVNTRLLYDLHKIVLPYNQNRITFNYTALSFINADQNRYAYMLEGFDEHWINTTSSQRSATYTNLSPGAYTFRVKASNSDGVWNNKGDSFMIIIDAPWWLRWWAWVIYISIFAAAVYSFVAYRTRKLIKDKAALEHQVQNRTEEVLQQKEEIEAQRDKLEMEKIRSDIAADFHDELGSTLSSIALYSEMAISDSSADERTKNILSLIGESSRGTVSAMQDMIWTIQPKNDSMQEVIYRMREYAYPLAELKNIGLTFAIGEDVQALILPMEIRKNIYLVFKEAVNNAFKYAAATSIMVSMTKKDSLLNLDIKDNGKGFDISDSNAGNGLRNMYKRAEQSGGTLSINSVAGGGTEILFSCPVA